jgi:hypothetical protein
MITNRFYERSIGILNRRKYFNPLGIKFSHYFGYPKGKSKWDLKVLGVGKNTRECIMSSFLTTIVFLVRDETKKTRGS